MACIRPLITLCPAEMDCLHPGCSLNPHVINAFLRLIERRSRFYIGLPSVFAFPVNFFQEWADGGFERTRSLTAGMDVLTHSLLLFPVLLSGEDGKGLWAIVVCRPGSATIGAYDPSLVSRRREMGIVFSFLAKVAEEQGDCLEERSWRFLDTPSDYPRPEKSESTGIFVCACVSCISLSTPFGKLQVDEKRWRRDVATALRRGRLEDEVFDLLEVNVPREQDLRYGGRVQPSHLSRLTVTTSDSSTEVVDVAIDPVSFRSYGSPRYVPIFSREEAASGEERVVTQETEEVKSPEAVGGESPALSLTADDLMDEIEEMCKSVEGNGSSIEVVASPNRSKIVNREGGFKVTIPVDAIPASSPILSDISSPDRFEDFDPVARGQPRPYREERVSAEMGTATSAQGPMKITDSQESHQRFRNPRRNRGRKRVRKTYRVRFQREDGTTYRRKFLKDEYRRN